MKNVSETTTLSFYGFFSVLFLPITTRFGVCCLFILQSGGSTVTENCTYVQSEGFPTALANQDPVQFTVQRCTNGGGGRKIDVYLSFPNIQSTFFLGTILDVCLLRLDFQTFDIMGPGGTAEAEEGMCTDTFMVTVRFEKKK